MSHKEKPSLQPAAPPASVSSPTPTTMSVMKAESESPTKTPNGQQEKVADAISTKNLATLNAEHDSHYKRDSSEDSIPRDKSHRQDSIAQISDDTAAHEDQPAEDQDTTVGTDSATMTSKPSSIGNSNSNRSFPVKLMKILDSEEFKDIFAWTKSGKSFSIYKPYELISKVLVVHFDGKCDMKFDSFLRKLYRWGFTKRSSSDEIDGEGDGGQVYFHENFQRGNYKLCALMNCNSKPSTNRPLVKGIGGMHQYNPYSVHGMMNPPSLDFGIDPIQMQMQLQQQQYLNRLYQQQHLQNLSGQNSLQYPYGQTSQGFFTRQRQEQEMMLLQQQQLHFANIAQQAHHPSSHYQTTSASALHTMAPRRFDYPPNNNLNAQMYNFAQQSLGSGGFVKAQNEPQTTNSQTNQNTTDSQLMQESNRMVESNANEEKPNVRQENLPGAIIRDEVTVEEPVKRKSNFEDDHKDKAQRVAPLKDGNDASEEEK